MSYTGATLTYKIPIPQDGDILSGETEALIATIIDNQLQLGAMVGPYVAEEGTYSVLSSSDGSYVVLLAGDPAVKGCLNNAFLKVSGSIQWRCSYPGINYLYLNAANDIFADPSAVSAVVLQSKTQNNAYVLMGYLDMTVPTRPYLNVTPPDKPILLNLVTLLSQAVSTY